MDNLLEQITKQTEELKKLLSEGWSKLEQRQKQLDEDRKSFEESLQNHKAKPSPSNKVTLDIGGSTFTTTKDTLIKIPDTFFSSMFSGSWHLKQEQDGSIFVDRDGTHFRYILNYMRTGELTVPDDPFIIKELIKETEFYHLVDLQNELIKFTSKPDKQEQEEEKSLFEDSLLVSLEHSKFLSLWHNDLKQRWKVIYRGGTHGFSSSQFHANCDNKGPTITVAKSTNGSLFGGYNPVSWSSRNTWITDATKAFIFTLTNPHQIPPTKYMPNNLNRNYVFDSANYLPAFGGGLDLYIASNGNSNNTSYTNFPVNYVDTTGKGNDTFTGSYNFTIAEIEVFAKVE